MSLTWKAAVEQDSSPFRIEQRGAYPRKGWTYEARVPEHHPLAGEHGTLAGYAHVESRPDRSDPGGYVHHINMVEVNPAYAKQGVGKALLSHTLHEARFENGVTHDGFTPDGARLWESVTGEKVRPSQRTSQPRQRDWRYA